MTVVALLQQPSSSYPLSSDESDYSGADAASHLRPRVIRRDTDNILSYYQSEHAGRTYLAADGDTAPAPSIMKEASTDSHSSSEYSSDSLDRHAHLDSNEERRQKASDGRRTRSVPSEGGADRRRLAIVELDSTLSPSLSRKRSRGTVHGSDDEGASVTSTIFSRRGIHVEGLALVAPPDVSPRTYTNLTPPSTAPLPIDHVMPSLHSTMHNRSMSEAVGVAAQHRHQRKSSRDVGIVGMGIVSGMLERDRSLGGGGEDFQKYTRGKSLKAPIFQTPAESRSPSPGRTPDTSESSAMSPQQAHSGIVSPVSDYERKEQEINTPAIGESKDISQPVVGPVVGLATDAMRRDPSHGSVSSASTPGPAFSSRYSPLSDHHSRTSPYLYYEPGVHSTAGPLPPPPQLSIDTHGISLPPSSSRPSRAYLPFPSPGSRPDLYALRDALALPTSVSAALAAMPPLASPKRAGSDLPDGSVSSREGQEDEAGPSMPLAKSKSLHVREGAHPPSTSTTTPPMLTDDTCRPSSDTNPHTATQADVSPTIPDIATSSTEDGSTSDDEVPSSLPPEKLLRPHKSGLDLRRQSSWLSFKKVRRAISPNSAVQQVSSAAVSRSSISSTSAISPTPPPKSNRASPDQEKSPATSSSNPFRGALSNLKRFSALPRTPSVTSSLAKSSSLRHSRTPSPSPVLVAPPRPPISLPLPRRPPVTLPPRPSLSLPSPPLPLPPPHVLRLQRPHLRIKAVWPDAMQCKDVTSRKSPLERSMGYAHKINDLAKYDCGLTEWLETQRPGPSPRSTQSGAVRWTVTPATPSTRVFVPQRRHPSDGSDVSEMTFPTRPDAYIATDLSTRAIDVVPANATPPALPYPSLAQAQSSRTPTRTSALISPSRTILSIPGSRSGGFFSSIGRRSSVKKDRPALSSVSPARILSKRHAASIDRPPIQVASAPSVPGGPRASPSRIQRSQTLSALAHSPVAEQPPPAANKPNRQSATTRRSSIFARKGPQVQAKSETEHATPAPTAPSPATPDPDFERQVDHLADILPHAERDILAAYLRRAGQDILAIGQYLEDEKNGTLRGD